MTNNNIPYTLVSNKMVVGYRYPYHVYDIDRFPFLLPRQKKYFSVYQANKSNTKKGSEPSYLKCLHGSTYCKYDRDSRKYHVLHQILHACTQT
jgi:hypothetical protein